MLGGPNAAYGLEVPVSYGNRTMDAAGESCFSIGALIWADGGTHTVSSSGGKLLFYSAAVTFNNGSTNLRVGIQDLSSGLEDGTFDVFDDLVGGTDTITANALKTVTFTDGSKSIANGALVAVGAEMTARGGGDTVTIRSVNNTTSTVPYASVDTGTGPTRLSVMVPVVIEADDGTVGWILGCPIPFTEDTVAISDTTTPDEIALIFQLPFPARIQDVVCYVQPQSGDSFDVKLYTDPLGTPSAQRTVSVDPTNTAQSAANNSLHASFSSSYDLAANTLYALAVRATGSAFNVSRMTMADADHRAASLLGTNWRYGSRSDSAGAFSETTTMLPRIGAYLRALDDGAGGGGGTTVIVIEDE